MRAALAALFAAALAVQAPAREVVDLAGRKVDAPADPERVACLEVLCYPTLFMLGAAERVKIMVNTAAPWMLATNPAVAGVPRLTGDADVEKLLALRIDLAFFSYNYARMSAKLATVRLPALVAQPLGRPAETADAYAARAKAMVMIYGRALGGEAERRAADWCAWFDERRAFVAGRLVALAPAERRKLYYVRGPRAENSQSRGGYVYWLATMAGAEVVAQASGQSGPGALSLEYVFFEDPDVIIVGRQYGVDLVAQDPRWRSVKAVRNGDVYPSPAGVFYWDGGPESALLMLFVARTLYPKLFADLDMVQEVKTYYARFYRVALDDDAARKILAGQWPDGRRFNPMNN
jgi:iron complex transport system substrate-binding protein